MAKNDQAGQAGKSDQSTREEAKHLAEEALEESRKGNKEEAEFVLGAARELDKQAVDEVVKSTNTKG